MQLTFFFLIFCGCNGLMGQPKLMQYNDMICTKIYDMIRTPLFLKCNFKMIPNYGNKIMQEVKYGKGSWGQWMQTTKLIILMNFVDQTIKLLLL